MLIEPIQMSDQAILDLINTLEGELAAKRLVYQTVTSDIGKLVDEQTNLQAELVNRIVMRGKENGVTPWPELLAYHYTEANYPLLQSTMRERSPQHWVTNAGYNDTTLQYNIQVMLNEKSGNHLDVIESLILEILPHLKKNENDERYLQLLEPTLSENGSYRLVEHNNLWTLQVTRWRRATNETQGMTLSEMLKHLQESHSFKAFSDDCTV